MKIGIRVMYIFVRLCLMDTEIRKMGGGLGNGWVKVVERKMAHILHEETCFVFSSSLPPRGFHQDTSALSQGCALE